MQPDVVQVALFLLDHNEEMNFQSVAQILSIMNPGVKVYALLESLLEDGSQLVTASGSDCPSWRQTDIVPAA